MKRRTVGLWVLIAFLAALSVATISGQLRINATNARIASQAQSGQRALNRQCTLVPIGRKIYGDALRRDVITTDDFELVVSSAEQACRQR